MKHTTLTPPPLKSLKIAIVSAILGLGAVSTENAQAKSPIEQIQDDAENRIQKLKIIENEDDADKLKQGELDQKKFQQYMVIKQSANNLTMMELDKNTGANTQKIENLRTLFETRGRTVENNEKSIKKNKANIKTLAKASAANKADADAKFKGVQTDIANNKITLANHAKKINDNQKAIEAKLGGKVDLQKLEDLKTSVDKNQADIADNINNIHELAQQQDQHGSDIRTLAKAGITNKDAIAKNTQSITTLDNKVNTFDGRISALDAKVNGFDGRINALDDKVENSMAAQAALNGLFQPYNVGKVSVSAAVGAYGSKSAIAVGAGYRVNPHLAFKGGAAINTSGSRKGSYNLGINYEF